MERQYIGLNVEGKNKIDKIKKLSDGLVLAKSGGGIIVNGRKILKFN